MKIMRTYIRAALTLEQLKDQFAKDIPDEVLEGLIRIDPTANPAQNRPGKYTPWIVKQYNKGNISEQDVLDSNCQSITDALDDFKTRGRRYAHTDLQQYKTVDEFLEDSRRVGNEGLTDKEKAKALKKAAHRASDGAKEFVTSDGDWEMWIPLTHAGDISLARDGGPKAEWCTAYEDPSAKWWKHYTSMGPLYVFLNKANPYEKYQWHLETKQFCDIKDHNFGQEGFHAFLAQHPNFADYFKVEVINGMTLIAGVITGVDVDTVDVVIPDNAKAISNGVRFPREMERISYPDWWEKLSGPALSSYTKLRFIHFPTSLKEIPASFCAECRSLKAVELPPQLIQINKYAFKNCSSLVDITLPNTLEVIDEQAFSKCSLLTELNIPDSVVNIKDGAFDEIDFDYFRFPASMEHVPARMFAGAVIGELDLDNVTSIGESAFYLAEVDSIEGLEQVTYFGQRAFKRSTIGDFDLNPNAIICRHAFEDCVDMVGSVTLGPDMLLGDPDDKGDPNTTDIFAGCSNLTVIWNRPDAPYVFSNIARLICPKNCTQLIAANEGTIDITTR